MRVSRFLLSVFVLLLCTPCGAQQTTATAPQASSLLLNSLRTMVGTASISDVTLTGTARRVAGSDDETGAATIRALVTGQTLMSYSFPSGQGSEVLTTTGGIPSGQWTGPDGKAHAMSQHNLLTDSSWFFPALTLTKLVASRASVVTLAGQETKDGVSVTRLTVTQQFPDVPADIAPLMQHVSQMDLFLDTTTLLPVALDFNIHPDNNMLLDIPVDIRFSDYRAVNGVQVPFRIEKFLNNNLFLDIQLQTATLNSGLAATAFTIQ